MDQKQRLEELADAVIPEGIAWVKEIRAYRIYKGKDQEYYQKARIGIGVLSGAIRLCATIENSRTNDMIEARYKVLGGDGEQKPQLPENNG